VFVLSDGTNYIAQTMGSGAVSTVNGAAGVVTITTTAGTGISVSGGGGTTPTVSIANNGVASAQMAAVNTRRTCIIENATQAATVLTTAQITGQCDALAAAHIIEIRIRADAGTPSALIEKWHCSTFTSGTCSAYTKTDMLSATLPAGTGGFNACAMTSTAQTCIDGTTSSGTIAVSASGVLAAGDIINVKSAVITGSPTMVHIEVIYTVD
jgi:hypothetical protein